MAKVENGRGGHAAKHRLTGPTARRGLRAGRWIEIREASWPILAPFRIYLVNDDGERPWTTEMPYPA